MLKYQTHWLPSLLAAVALVVALAALFGPRSTPAEASSLVAQTGPAAALGSDYSLASGTVPPDIVAQPAPNVRVYLPLITQGP